MALTAPGTSPYCCYSIIRLNPCIRLFLRSASSLTGFIQGYIGILEVRVLALIAPLFRICLALFAYQTNRWPGVGGYDGMLFPPAHYVAPSKVVLLLHMLVLLAIYA